MILSVRSRAAGTLSPSKRCQPSRRLARQPKGYSLIEVLVAILVLSFGLLGIVGMQAAALQANREARLQSLAATFATELTELMRDTRHAGLLPGGNPYFGDFTSPLQPARKNYCLSTTSAGGCADALELAQAQMSDWLARVDLELPGARVQICADAKPYDEHGLPQWSCAAGAGALTVVKMGWIQSNGRWKGAASAERLERPSLVLPFPAGPDA